MLEYLDVDGDSPFGAWFEALPPAAAAKVATARIRMARGNRSAVRGVGAGVSEYKIDFGPGYRIYFGIDGPTLIILLGGGTKKRQQRDIETAQTNWADYKHRKHTER